MKNHYRSIKTTERLRDKGTAALYSLLLLTITPWRWPAWTGFLTANGGLSWESQELLQAGAGTCFISRDAGLVTIVSEADAVMYLVRMNIPVTKGG